MKEIKGACRYCGQIKILQVSDREEIEEHRADDIATGQCECEEAREERKNLQKEAMKKFVAANAHATIQELYEEDKPEIADLLMESIELFITKKVKKITIDTGDSVKAVIGVKNGAIEVQRVEKNTESRMTPME